MEKAQASLALRASSVHVMRAAGLTLKTIGKEMGWDNNTLKKLLKIPFKHLSKTVAKKKWEVLGLMLGDQDYERAEAWCREQDLLILDLGPVDDILAGVLESRSIEEVDPTTIPGIPQIFALAKKHGCSEDAFFEEAGRMIRSQAVVIYTKAGVSFAPIPDEAIYDKEVDSEGNDITTVQVGSMKYDVRELVPDVNRRIKGMEQLSKALGINMKERAALIEADERMKIAREEQEIKRENLNLRKKAVNGADEKEIVINLGLD